MSLSAAVLAGQRNWFNRRGATGADFRYNPDPSFENDDLGFRVASIPEPNVLECDFNADVLCNNADLDILFDDIAAGTAGGPTDLDGNGIVDNEDITAWLALAGTENGHTYLPGDTNLDGEVDGPDFTTLATFFGNAGSDPNDANAYWRHGNFNGKGSDGTFDVGGPDFTSLATYFGHASVLSVPEPSHDWLLIGAICLFSILRRYHAMAL